MLAPWEISGPMNIISMANMPNQAPMLCGMRLEGPRLIKRSALFGNAMRARRQGPRSNGS
jgi:hypothetical protein